MHGPQFGDHVYFYAATSSEKSCMKSVADSATEGDVLLLFVKTAP